MTSDKSGPVRATASALEGDLETTRDRKAVPETKAPVKASDAKPARGDTGRSSASNGSAVKDRSKRAGADSEAAASGPQLDGDVSSEPTTTPSPAAKAGSAKPGSASASASAPEDSSSAVPTTGGVWRSGYEAGRSDKGLRPVKKEATPSDGEAVSASATTENPDGVKAGAMKAAHAALDAARSAAKKVSSIMPDDEQQPTPAPNGNRPRPEMHYTAGAVRGTATARDAATEVPETQTPGQPTSSPTPEAARAAPAGPRRVRLAISRVDPWSVMKLAFLLAVAIAIMTVVATAVFWSVLNSFGVFTTVQEFVVDAVGPQSDVNLTQFVEFPRVISLATLIGICNIVLLTAIATIMAFLYNITAALVGGVHMTLTDD